MGGKWYQELLDGTRPDPERKYELLALSVRKATTAQKAALTGLAQLLGYKDLRGFYHWLEYSKKSYYDLIKIASPE